MKKSKTQNFFEALKKAFELKGFVLAVIFFLIVFVLFVLTSFGFLEFNSSEMEKAIIARASFEQNQAKLLESIRFVDEELKKELESKLAYDYLQSAKQDFEWLLKKEKELYYGSAKQVITKELAFSFVMNYIYAINDDLIFYADEEDFRSEINKAIDSKFSFEEKISSNFYNELQEEIDAELFKQTIRKLLEEYYYWKISIIKSNTSLERKFIEAKKVNYLV